MIPAPVERSVVIATPPPVSTFPMPTAAELSQLIDAVGRRFPALLDTQGPAFEGTRHERREQYRKQFEGAFLAIGHMKRLERPDTKLYVSAHVQLAESILRSLGRPMTIRGDPFLAACLAHFDVPISGIGRTHEGIVVEIGLNQYTGRPATDQWRRILEGQPPREVAVSGPPPAPNPARVHVTY